MRKNNFDKKLIKLYPYLFRTEFFVGNENGNIECEDGWKEIVCDFC